MSEEHPNTYHIYPLGNGEREHVLDGSPCWCNPVRELQTETDELGQSVVIGVQIVHTAADGRTTQARPYLHGAN